jgi:hypothetical protein
MIHRNKSLKKFFFMGAWNTELKFSDTLSLALFLLIICLVWPFSNTIIQKELHNIKIVRNDLSESFIMLENADHINSSASASAVKTDEWYMGLDKPAEPTKETGPLVIGLLDYQLTNSYTGLYALSAKQCWQHCSQDSQCIASSFTHDYHASNRNRYVFSNVLFWFEFFFFWVQQYFSIAHLYFNWLSFFSGLIQFNLAMKRFLIAHKVYCNLKWVK